MPSIEEQYSERFAKWEERTRGWRVFPTPVAPEPPFAVFPGHYLNETPLLDDGRRPTAVSSVLRTLLGRPLPSAAVEEEDDTEPAALEREAVVEFPLYLPQDFKGRGEGFESFLRSLFICQEPVSFELVGTGTQVTAQLAVSKGDSELVRLGLRAHFPDLVSTPANALLESAWHEAEPEAAVVEFGLARECMLPLATIDHDPYVALVGAMSELKAGECAVFQVIWQSLENKWAENLVRSVTDATGKAFFVNAPELASAVQKKTARPLYAAVVRLAATSADFDRTWEILRTLSSGLRTFAEPNGNELIPLRNDDYPYDEHIEDVVRRQARRTGMILNADELLGLVHLPDETVRSSKFQRMRQKTKPAPSITAHATGLVLGQNGHAGEIREVRLSRDQRRKHMHVIGASGTGKTSFLYNLIRQDIEAGEGLAVLDPHGDLIDRILGSIPKERIDDVVLLDPGDEEFSIGFNILSAHSDSEKNLLASDLVSVFQRLSTSWGDQMGVVLNNAIRAFLESTRGGTLADLRRFLLEPTFREKFLHTVSDPDIVYYWRKGFTQLTGNRSIGPVMTRLETFLSPKPIRYMVSQTENRLDFAQILDGGKILLAKLSQGAIGKENSYLLGSLLMAKFQQIAMGRQRQEEAKRRDFWLYLDEFHNFITPSTAEILSGARKYHIGLALAHQELRQLQRDSEVASAVLANPYTRVCFRVGDQDARVLEHGFSTFQAKDLQNLGTGEAVCRVERSDYDFNLAIPQPQDPAEDTASARRKEIIEASRAKYATPRAKVERDLAPPVEIAPPEPPVNQPVTKKVADRPPKWPQPVVIPAPPDQGWSNPPVPPSEVLEPAPPVLPTLVAPPVAPPPLPPAALLAPPLVPPVNQPPAAPVPVVNQVPEAAAPAARPTTADLGRGGAQHQAIQLRIKEAAEALGFRVFVEKSTSDGRGQVDLVLEREGLTIACEVTVTTSIDQELRNVSKCLKAGFEQVVVVSGNPDKLVKIGQAVRTSLGKEAAAKVTFEMPDDLIARLGALKPPEPKPGRKPATKKVRGWKVTTTHGTLSPDEIAAREQKQIQLLAENMRKNAPAISTPTKQ